MTNYTAPLRFRAWMLDMKATPEPVKRMFYRVQIQTHAPYKWDYIVRGASETTEENNMAFDFDAVVMQSTGLFDKNNKEIFGGDIIKNNDHVWLVYWHNGCFRLAKDGVVDKEKDFLFIDEEQHSEVIGNCFENPELLEGEA